MTEDDETPWWLKYMPSRRFALLLECGHKFLCPDPIYPGAVYLCTHCKENGEDPFIMEVTAVVVIENDNDTKETESGS